MKKKLILLMFLMLSLCYTLLAQSIWINGVIFNKEGKDLYPIPFASVYYCDSMNHDDVKYVAFTDMSGVYDLGKNIEVRDYYVKISAPGYKSIGKNVNKLPNSLEGPYTLHFSMKKKNDIEYSKKTYLATDLEMESKNIFEIVSLLPEVTFKNGSYYTKDDEKIKILGCGYSIPKNKYEMLRNLSNMYIEKIEYYDLKKVENSKYPAVVNVVLMQPTQAGGKLDFVPVELYK
ncbi:hypothetical protein E0494_08685 [Marinilabiliaceae bacterium JC040]|nr:hypothetical protein [Marinilabiliaceae bacterium JC040]